MIKLLKYFFFAFIVKPLVYIILGINVRNKNQIPSKGPAILIANHNSHLDTMVLMSLFPLCWLNSIHPIAVADYFLKNNFIKWFSLNIIEIIPVKRTNSKETLKEFFKKINNYLNNQKILILYPEGTRGTPEEMGELKNGIAYIAKNNPKVPIIPFYMFGLGKALPKDEAILVPFICDIYIGNAIYWNYDKEIFMDSLRQSFKNLKSQHYKNQKYI